MRGRMDAFVTDFGTYTEESLNAVGTLVTDNGTVTDEGLRALDVLKASLIGITALLIILGNSFCLVVLRLTKDAPVVSRIFMASLTSADLLIGALVVAPVCVSSIFNAWPVLHREFCYIHEIASSMLGAITVLCLFVVSIDRYISVSRPLRYETLITKRVTLALVLLVWVLPCLTRVALTPYRTGYEVEFRQDNDMCWLVPGGPHDVTYGAFLFIYTCITLPFSATCIIYVKLFLVARRHTRCIASQPSDSSIHRRRPVSQFRRNTKSAITFFMLTLTFGVSWTPFVISWLYRAITSKSPSEVLVILIQLLSFSNSWANCLVYYFRNHIFQRTAKDLLLRGRPCRCSSRVVPLHV